ncbi:hypothetical protein P3342_004717 [Pyrenophora teres f. teres]|nr:hypothetical protein P3342_004717 [Pyrenophora teres f. teres]
MGRPTIKARSLEVKRIWVYPLSRDAKREFKEHACDLATESEADRLFTMIGTDHLMQHNDDSETLDVMKAYEEARGVKLELK